ncbi:MAG: 3-oxoacyl-ACP reductase FabG [Clostridia bacterium]|nr:3-oxoacyl-ACP reductase FabG [Clostridia bacterium]
MGKVALVTGASRGIGRAVAVRLAQMGYDIAVLYHEATASAHAVVEQLNGFGVRAIAYPCDVADSVAVNETVERITDEMGEISALVNNAGVAQQKLFTDLTDEDWHRMMGVNLDGTFFVTRAVLKGMLQRHEGTIVNVSSMWGQVGASCEVHYSAAKAAVIGMTKALAKEVGPSGVRVNCVAPGVIKTDMMRDFDEETLAALTDETPLMRLGSPEDVANVVAFLLSDEASFITGQVIAPNGGFVI